MQQSRVVDLGILQAAGIKGCQKRMALPVVV